MVAPPGKLGLVIANPRQKTPIVLEMKDASALQGKVHVGDLLLSLDEVDCHGLLASEVSALVGGRSQEPLPILMLLQDQ